MTLQDVMITLKKNDGPGPSAYRENLRAPVRGLWSGIMNIDQAFVAFDAAVRLGITKAWEEGISKCGVQLDELSRSGQLELNQFILDQRDHIFNFLVDVENGNKSNGGQLSKFFKRLELWVNQYESASIMAGSSECSDLNMIWVLGDAEHCDSCKKLAGIVKPYSFWKLHVLPRNAPNDKLVCGGHECDCDLKPTNLPVTLGPLPSLP